MSAVLSPSEDRSLYLSDPAAWRAYAAPRVACRLQEIPDAGLGGAWERMGRELQLCVWDLLDADQKARVREVRLGHASFEVNS